jgi:hypothetical protein
MNIPLKSFLFGIVLIVATTFSFAQEGMDQNEKMNKWMEYMTPGEMHEMLAKSVGEWKSVSRWWMDPSSEEPMESEGVANFEMILGGRYQKSYHTGEVMGMPMEGINILGYDNATEEFTAVWIDNMGTGTAISRGKYDEATQSIVMSGSMIDPMTDKEMAFKQIYKKIDDNHQMVEMYIDFNGQKFKSMEVELMRQ